MLPSITPKPSRGCGPEGRKPWAALAGPQDLTQRGWWDQWAGETQDSAGAAISWHTQGHHTPIQAQQHFIRTPAYVLPSYNCANKAPTGLPMVFFITQQ